MRFGAALVLCTSNTYCGGDHCDGVGYFREYGGIDIIFIHAYFLYVCGGIPIRPLSGLAPAVSL
jgi:hypothetical protein